MNRVTFLMCAATPARRVSGSRQSAHGLVQAEARQLSSVDRNCSRRHRKLRDLDIPRQAAPTGGITRLRRSGCLLAELGLFTYHQPNTGAVGWIGRCLEYREQRWARGRNQDWGGRSDADIVRRRRSVNSRVAGYALAAMGAAGQPAEQQPTASD